MNSLEYPTSTLPTPEIEPTSTKTIRDFDKVSDRASLEQHLFTPILVSIDSELSQVI